MVLSSQPRPQSQPRQTDSSNEVAAGGSDGGGGAAGHCYPHAVDGEEVNRHTKAHQVLDLLSSFADLVPRHEAELRRLVHSSSSSSSSSSQQQEGRGRTAAGGSSGDFSSQWRQGAGDIPSAAASATSGGAAVAGRLRALVASLARIVEDDNDGSPTAAAAAAAAAAPPLPAAAVLSGGNEEEPPSAPASFSPSSSSSLTSHSAASSPSSSSSSGPTTTTTTDGSHIDAAVCALSTLFPPSTTTAAMPTVLSSADLLHTIIGCLVQSAPAHEARTTLNTLSLVSRRFRTLSAWDEWWRPVAVGLLPVLGVKGVKEGKEGGKRSGGAAAGAGAGGGGGKMVEAEYRAYLLRYGRSLLGRRAWMGEALEDGLTLGFEVWDAADGLRMLSASGPIRVQIDQAGGFTSLRIGGADRKEVPGPPFSAASRDPEHRRFASMDDFFSRCHQPELPSSLCVRVTVTDDRTGRMALLWSTKKDASYLTEAPLAYWEPYLSEGAISVFLDHWSPLMCPAYDGESMTVTIGFHVCTEPNQAADTPEQERLYRLAGGDAGRYEEHASFISITAMTLNTNAIHQFFRALLKDD